MGVRGGLFFNQVEVTQDGIDAIAGFAEKINRSHQDIGARRVRECRTREGGGGGDGRVPQDDGPWHGRDSI